MTRRADAFAMAVDRADRLDPTGPSGPGAPSGPTDARTADLLALVGALRAVPEPAPARAEFVADLRARLMAAAAEELRTAPCADQSSPSPTTRTVRTSRSPRERRIAAALAGLALVGATGSMAVAAGSALPGDVLYPVKRVLEDARTGLTADDQRGDQLLAHADSRLSELRELGERGGGGPTDAAAEDTLRETLQTFSDQAVEAARALLKRYRETGDERAIAALRAFTADSVQRLAELEAVLPDSVRPAVVAAAAVLVDIDQAATDACPGCGGSEAIRVPPALMPVSSEPSDTTGPGSGSGSGSIGGSVGGSVGETVVGPPVTGGGATEPAVEPTRPAAEPTGSGGGVRPEPGTSATPDPDPSGRPGDPAPSLPVLPTVDAPVPPEATVPPDVVESTQPPEVVPTASEPTGEPTPGTTDGADPSTDQPSQQATQG